MTTKTFNILFPVDFSKRSVIAVQHVKIWVDRFGATLNTLHIVDATALGHYDEFRWEAPLWPSALDSDILDLISRRTADLKYFSDHYFGENVARHTVMSGGTADEIESFAKRESIDLIMLPRNHQNLGSRILEDSLAAKLLERCAASVWTTEYVDDLSPSPVHSILCALHFEPDATLDAQNHRIIQTVQEIAAMFQAKVAFLQVIHGHGTESIESVTDLRTVGEIEPWVAQVQEMFGSSVEIVRKPGDIITEISDTAKQLDADLIVVGRTRPGTIGLGLQTHILKIDHAAHRPVLSVW